MNKKTLSAFAVVTVLGLGVLGASGVSAQNATNTQNPMTSLAQRIAERFNLSQSDVQAVFDEVRKEKPAKMQANSEAQLSQLVTEGKITEAQKQLILQKRAELDAQRAANKESSKNLSQDERKAKMQAEKTALETWAKENGIDPQYLMPQKGRGHGRFGMLEKRPTGASSTTVAPSTTE